MYVPYNVTAVTPCPLVWAKLSHASSLTSEVSCICLNWTEELRVLGVVQDTIHPGMWNSSVCFLRTCTHLNFSEEFHPEIAMGLSASVSFCLCKVTGNKGNRTLLLHFWETVKLSLEKHRK